MSYFFMGEITVEIFENTHSMTKSDGHPPRLTLKQSSAIISHKQHLHLRTNINNEVFCTARSYFVIKSKTTTTTLINRF